MTDKRLAILAKRGIQGEDATTCLKEIDTCDWAEIVQLAQQFDIDHERVDFYRSLLRKRRSTGRSRA